MVSQKEVGEGDKVNNWKQRGTLNGPMIMLLEWRNIINLMLCTMRKMEKRKSFILMYRVSSSPSLPSSSFSSSFFAVRLTCIPRLLWTSGTLVGRPINIIRYRAETKKNWGKKAKVKDSSATLLFRVERGMKAMHKAKKNKGRRAFSVSDK